METGPAAERQPDRSQYTIHNPATGQVVATYAVMDQARVDEAVKRARSAFAEWSGLPLKKRARVLQRAVHLLAEEPERHAAVIGAETGKTRLDALLADIYPVLDLLAYYARNLERFLKPVREPASVLLPGRKAYYLFEPKGVVGIISPWNYPFILTAGPAVSALAAGNAVVIKPSSQTTGTGLAFAQLMQAAGLPAGVLQVLTGNGPVTGQALVANAQIDMFVFTGSTEVGKSVAVKAAERMVPTIMELGGKDAAIVTRHADIARAAHAIVWGAFTNSGQTCIGVKRVLVERAIFPEFTAKVREIMAHLQSGLQSGEIGAMTLDEQVSTVKRQLEEARRKGARILAQGKGGQGQGRFLPPVALVDTQPDMAVEREETFGPLLPLIPFDTLDEALEVANRSEYGLSGAVFTRNLAEGRRIAARLQTGSVSINDVLITFALPSLPFGGRKKSGIGRYHGRIGLQAFCNVKAITESRWNIKKELWWYPVPPRAEELAGAVIRVLFARSPSIRLAALGRVVGIGWGLVWNRARRETQ